MTKSLTFLIFCNLLFINVMYSNTDTLKLYYNINQSILTAEHLNKIDKLFNLSKDASIEDIQIYGYTDFLANDDYNLKLSELRANQIKNYLKTKGFSKILKSASGKENYFLNWKTNHLVYRRIAVR